MLVAEGVARRPPRLQVGVLGFGDEDAPEPRGGGWFGVVVEGQFVEPFQIEGERAALPVDLQPQCVLPSGGHPGRLERGQRPGGEPAGEQRRVVDGHRPSRTGVRRSGQPGRRAREPGPFAYEGLADRRHPDQRLPRQILGQVDDMGAQVAECARAGAFPLQPPGERRFGVDEPVLEVGGANVPQGAEPPLGDQVPGVRDRGHPAVVEAHHGDLAAGRRALRGLGHRLGLGDRVGERLLAQHVLARLQGGDGDLGMAVAGGADVDELHIVPGDEGAPVGLRRRPAMTGGGRVDRGPVASADRGESRPHRQVEDVSRGAPAL